MTNFYKICLERKNMSKVLLALWLIYLIDVNRKSWGDIYSTLDLICKYLNEFGANLDENMSKINVDYTDKFQLDYRQILINRGYLLHWGLFVLKEEKNGIERYLNVLFHDKNLPIV